MDHAAAMAELLAGHGFRRMALSRTPVGHLTLRGEIDGRSIDFVLDTGAGKSFVELGYCRAEGIEVIDTGDPGAPAAGAGPGGTNVHRLGEVELTLGGLNVRTDGIFAIDMTHTNTKLAARGVEPIRAVIGQDVLRHHQAVIDYATLALYLLEEPVSPAPAAV